MTRYVGAIDQGTTSSRFIVFDRAGNTVASAQREHRQIYPQPGWVEHDPIELLDNTLAVIAHALHEADLTPRDLAAVGITNQRETTLLWDRATGRPVHNALVWQDTRTDSLVAEFARNGGQDRFRAQTGLPLASYFSALKLRWLLDNVPDARRRAEAGDLAFGTVDTWLLWHLTGEHITDVTNASRTQLMDLATLQWDDALLSAFGIPRAVLPRIVPSSAVYANARAPLEGVPVAGILGDQQAALLGQACCEPGEAKNTYGTGCFLLMHTGTTPRPSQHGLITTVAGQFGDAPACYALEGSIAVTGALVQWLRDNLGIIRASRRCRGARCVGAGQWRRVFRAGILRPVRAVLAQRCARRDGRADAVRHRRPHRPRRIGSERLPDARCRARHGAGFGDCDQDAAGGWRDGGERIADAVPGRHAERSGGAAADFGNDRAGGSLRRGAGGRVLAGLRRSPRQLGGHPHMDADDGRASGVRR